MFRVYLHYHDYILDGRWVVTENIDSDDKSAVVRNLGDGWDDEECPEKESYVWQLRSKKAPGEHKTNSREQVIFWPSKKKSWVKAITPSIELNFRLKDISYVRITKLMIDAGWIGDSQLRLEQYIKEKELLRSAKLLLDKKNGVVTLT